MRDETLTVVLTFLFAAAATADGNMGTGLKDSPHDFSRKQAITVGLCTFCHTPHRAGTTRLLWNHKLPAGTYSWKDVTETSGGTAYPTIKPEWGGPTKFCLSCHDGSVAIGDIYWWSGQAPATPLNSDRAPDVVGDAIAMPGNHPVAMPYPYDRLPSTYNGVTTGPGVRVETYKPRPELEGIPLYTDPGNGGVRPGGSVGRAGLECSSCHDVHNGPTAQDGDLLRGKGDGLCNKCHIR